VPNWNKTGVPNMIRNDKQTGNFIGLGSIQFSVYVLIEESFMEQAAPLLEEFLKRNDITQ